ncbi:pyridoxine 5'-phosphate synthase [Vulgatibacter incomptus]|uniref:Pyridoxine 5'-phosphate synthase n=1 Tax=Vulgatibacter incomptus TaxID=1391653 RepID=A0A0K1PDP4_9BACT|nr:pyridoxine 5'-phosphate synthase [Vulgatibacter incomptus]AKU91627.1 Pyridoxine 5'-phosphate synthase [Vulgatibacter incomptus]
MPLPTCRLGVNVDHVATLRQARRATYPDPVTAASLCELAGADQITIHLREDRRHIQDRDLRLMRETVQSRLNLEMAATREMLSIAVAIRPDTVTLVPEKRAELTTEGGLDAAGNMDSLRPAVRELRDAGIEVSLFLDPEVAQLEAARSLGAQRVEIHTGTYCESAVDSARAKELARVVEAARHAAQLDLGVAAGHGLNYFNVEPIAAIPEIDELNIGHAIVARAVLVGMERAVHEMVALIARARA